MSRQTAETQLVLLSTTLSACLPDVNARHSKLVRCAQVTTKSSLQPRRSPTEQQGRSKESAMLQQPAASIQAAASYGHRCSATGTACLSRCSGKMTLRTLAKCGRLLTPPLDRCRAKRQNLSPHLTVSLPPLMPSPPLSVVMCVCSRWSTTKMACPSLQPIA